MTDVISHICHVLHRAEISIREAGRAEAGRIAPRLHIGVAESSEDHMVLQYEGVNLHRLLVLSGQCGVAGVGWRVAGIQMLQRIKSSAV